MMVRSRYTIRESNEPYFLTATIVDWLPLFGIPSMAAIVLDSLGYLSDEDRWKIFAYVLMEHHLHWVAAASDLTDIVRVFKSYTARRMIDQLKAESRQALLRRLRKHARPPSRHRVWQPGSHAKQIQSPAMMRQKIAYIHNNPVTCGYVDDPSCWRYSSARTYERQEDTGVPVAVNEW